MEATASKNHRTRLTLDVLSLVGLAAIAGLFWEVNILRSGTTPFALANFDLFSEFFPRHSFAGTTLRRGELPLWDPHQIGGLPFLATLQGGVLYPPNLLYALLPTSTAMGALSLLHIILAGAFMFLLSRELGRGTAASCLAGLTFMLGGSTLFLIYHTNAINSAPWLPAALYCTSRLGREGNLRWALLLGVVVSLQFLAGRDYTFVMSLDATALFVVFQVVWMIRDRLGLRRIGKHVWQLAVGALLAAGLVSAQLLPTLALAEQSGRTLSGLAGEFLEIFGPMPPALFLANLINPARGALRREYFGWIPLVCFLVSFRLWGRDRPAIFATLISALAVLLSFGSQTPLYAAYRALPLGATFRLPDRFVFLFSFGLSLGAASGFDRIFAVNGSYAKRLRSLWPRMVLLLCLGFGLLLALGSGWLESKVHLAARPWGWLSFYGVTLDHFASMKYAMGYFVAVAVLLAFAVWCAGGKKANVLKLAILLLAAGDLGFALENRFLHPARDPLPALAAARCYDKVRLIAGEFGRHLSLRLPGSFWLKDKDGEIFSTYSATHYEPLVTRRQGAFFSALQEGGTPITPSPWNERSLFMGFLTRFPTPERLKLLDLMGTSVVLASGDRLTRPPALSALLSRFELVERCVVSTARASAPIDVFANPRALPRAFIVHRDFTARSPEEALGRMVASDFDPRREAVVEGNVSHETLMGEGSSASHVAITVYQDSRVVLQAETGEPALLVLTDSYDPEWLATLDGEHVTVYPADGLFRGVFLPAGKSEVVFRYRATCFYWGAAISAITGGIWLVLWVYSRASAVRRRRASSNVSKIPQTIETGGVRRSGGQGGNRIQQIISWRNAFGVGSRRYKATRGS
jgi:hypothetical protein